MSALKYLKIKRNIIGFDRESQIYLKKSWFQFSLNGHDVQNTSIRKYLYHMREYIFLSLSS
jgi:hypothetical protein